GGAVVDQGGLLAAATVDVEIQRVVAGIQHAAHEPARERRARAIEDPVPAPVPVDVLGRRGPESFRISHRTRVLLVVDRFHALKYTRGPAAISAALDEVDPEGDGGGAQEVDRAQRLTEAQRADEE